MTEQTVIKKRQAISKPIKRYIIDYVGAEAYELVQIINRHGQITDVEIFGMLQDEEPNVIRSRLYKLMEFKVAKYRVQTDKKQWDTYLWQLTLNDAQQILDKQRDEQVEILQKQLYKEQNNQYYVSPLTRRRFNLEDAMDIGFKCPDTGADLQYQDNEKIIETLSKQIAALTS